MHKFVLNCKIESRERNVKFSTYPHQKSKEEVQTATTENTKAQEAAKAAEANSAEVQAEQTEVKQQSTELESGIAEGEQRLEQMTNENSNVDTGTNSSLGEETSSGNVESTG